jgi:divalent metal cation (Fe/Co/Zn/Cd) transporter
MSGVTRSGALRADAAQSALCAYLSLIALAEMAVNLIWRVEWADPLAALAIVPLIVWEGREAMRGKACGCCWFALRPRQCVILSLAQSITKTCDFNHTRGFGGSL